MWLEGRGFLGRDPRLRERGRGELGNGEGEIGLVTYTPPPRMRVERTGEDEEEINFGYSAAPKCTLLQHPTELYCSVIISIHTPNTHSLACTYIGRYMDIYIFYIYIITSMCFPAIEVLINWWGRYIFRKWN